MSLTGLFWPLSKGGQVSRFRSGSIQIHRAMVIYILFSYLNTIYVGSYFRPIFLWTLAQIYLRYQCYRPWQAYPCHCISSIIAAAAGSGSHWSFKLCKPLIVQIKTCIHACMFLLIVSSQGNC
jgi:hypothetical protein